MCLYDPVNDPSIGSKDPHAHPSIGQSKQQQLCISDLTHEHYMAWIIVEAAKIGVCEATVRSRYYRDWDPVQIITTPTGQRRT
jgi:hypothetical protein